MSAATRRSAREEPRPERKVGSEVIVPEITAADSNASPITSSGMDVLQSGP